MPIQNLIPIGAGPFTSSDFVVPASHKAVIMLKWPPGHAALHSEMRLEQKLADGSYDSVALLRGGRERQRHVVDVPGTYRLYRIDSNIPSGADIVLGTDYATSAFDPLSPVYSARAGIYGFDFQDNEFQRLESRGQRLVTVQDGWTGTEYERLLSRSQRRVTFVDTRNVNTNAIETLQSASNRLVVRVDGEAFADASILSLTLDNTLQALPAYVADYVDVTNPSATETIAYARGTDPTTTPIAPLAQRRIVLPTRNTNALRFTLPGGGTLALTVDAVRRAV